MAAFKAFLCELFKKYHILHLKTDVLLLADDVENFRNTCLTYHDLDHSKYLRSPGMAWEAMLFKTGVNLDLITVLEVLGMIEKESGAVFGSWVLRNTVKPTINTPRLCSEQAVKLNPIHR